MELKRHSNRRCRFSRPSIGQTASATSAIKRIQCEHELSGPISKRRSRIGSRSGASRHDAHWPIEERTFVERLPTDIRPAFFVSTISQEMGARLSSNRRRRSKHSGSVSSLKRTSLRQARGAGAARLSLPSHSLLNSRKPIHQVSAKRMIAILESGREQMVDRIRRHSYRVAVGPANIYSSKARRPCGPSMKLLLLSSLSRV